MSGANQEGDNVTVTGRSLLHLMLCVASVPFSALHIFDPSFQHATLNSITVNGGDARRSPMREPPHHSAWATD